MLYVTSAREGAAGLHGSVGEDPLAARFKPFAIDPAERAMLRDAFVQLNSRRRKPLRVGAVDDRLVRHPAYPEADGLIRLVPRVRVVARIADRQLRGDRRQRRTEPLERIVLARLPGRSWPVRMACRSCGRSTFHVDGRGRVEMADWAEFAPGRGRLVCATPAVD